MATQFPQFFTSPDFTTVSSVTSLTANQYTQLTSYTVPAQQVINWGQGVINGGVDSRENGSMEFWSSSGRIAGKIRLAVSDANGITTAPVYENNHTNWASNVKVGLATPAAKENSKLLILFKPTSTVSVVSYSINLPVTITAL